jgi:hypothetical protein
MNHAKALLGLLVLTVGACFLSGAAPSSRPADPAASSPSTPSTSSAQALPAAATRPAITIGHDTTRITKPLRADGTPDYLAAINEEYSSGVTPRNNLATRLFAIFDPKALYPDDGVKEAGHEPGWSGR